MILSTGARSRSRRSNQAGCLTGRSCGPIGLSGCASVDGMVETAVGVTSLRLQMLAMEREIRNMVVGLIASQ